MLTFELDGSLCVCVTGTFYRFGHSFTDQRLPALSRVS